MAEDRSYQDDEVRAIIARALEAQPGGGVSHDDLLAIGAGVGLSRAALERAAVEVRDARLNDAARARVLSRRVRGMLAHAFVFSAVNAFLFLVNFLTTPGQWWVLFPVFGWGLGLLLHAGFALSRGISPARLQRERRRLEPQLPSSSARNAPAEQTGGVRVAAAPTAPATPVAEQPDESATPEAQERLGARTAR